jgi:hypothetical protein
MAGKEEKKDAKGRKTERIKMKEKIGQIERDRYNLVQNNRRKEKI